MKTTTQTIAMYVLVACIVVSLFMVAIYPLVIEPIGEWIRGLTGVKEEPETGIEKPEGFIYSGNLKVNLIMYDLYDDSQVTPTDIVTKIWHKDQKTLFGSVTMDGTDEISGQVLPEDEGILYVSVDHEATTIYYVLDAQSESATGFLTALTPRDVDDDGVLEHYYKLDLTWLTPLEAGETQKEITINFYALDADVTGLDIVSQLNATSSDFSGSSYVDAIAEGYISGVSEGDGFKIVRVELTMPNAANESYVEDGKVKNVWVQLGDYKWTVLQWQPGQDRYLVWEATDVTQEVYGKVLFYERGAGTTWCKYIVHIQGANFGAGASWVPTLKITYIDPSGTIGTISQVISFTDT